MAQLKRTSRCNVTFVLDEEGYICIPASLRSDGTVRKPIRVRKGFTPSEEMPKYVCRGKLEELQRNGDSVASSVGVGTRSEASGGGTLGSRSRNWDGVNGHYDLSNQEVGGRQLENLTVKVNDKTGKRKSTFDVVDSTSGGLSNDFKYQPIQQEKDPSTMKNLADLKPCGPFVTVQTGGTGVEQSTGRVECLEYSDFSNLPAMRTNSGNVSDEAEDSDKGNALLERFIEDKTKVLSLIESRSGEDSDEASMAWNKEKVEAWNRFVFTWSWFRPKSVYD